MDHIVVSSGGRPQGSFGVFGRFAHWMAEAIRHAFGNPREEAAHQPPSVGVQPYRDKPGRPR